MDEQKEKFAIGIDLGGTKLEVGVVDNKGKIHHRKQYRTRVQEGYKEIKKDIENAIQEMQEKAGSPIAVIGIGMAGQIEPNKGIVKFAPNLRWHDVPLKEDLEKSTKLPVLVTNDVRAATWGEWLYGAGKGCQDLVCLFVGTGIGGGVVSNGRMLTGANNTAGELGHMTIDFNGPICSCGNHGCFEAFAGGWAIEKKAHSVMNENVEKGRGILQFTNGKIEDVTPKEIMKAALDNDPLANEILQEAQRALIAGCTSIVNAFNPSRLILGGGIIKNFPNFIVEIESGVKKYALKAATEKLSVEKAHFKDEAAVVGSAAWAIQSLSNRGNYS